jgi:hypothetical protein
MVVLAWLVIGFASVGGSPAATRAAGRIKAMSFAMSAYFTDKGTYPRNADTDALDPATDLKAGGDSKGRYERASLHLYRELSGDREPLESPDGRPEAGIKSYFSFPRSEVATDRDSTGAIRAVKYLQDPYGNSWGYSTLPLATAEASDGNEVTASAPTASFYLWSTAGDHRKQWIKSWP